MCSRLTPPAQPGPARRTPQTHAEASKMEVAKQYPHRGRPRHGPPYLLRSRCHHVHRPRPARSVHYRPAPHPKGPPLECRLTGSDPRCTPAAVRWAPRGTVSRRLTHIPYGHRPTTLLLRIRRYTCTGCSRFWQEGTSTVAPPPAGQTEPHRPGLGATSAGGRPPECQPGCWDPRGLSRPVFDRGWMTRKDDEHGQTLEVPARGA